MIETTHAKLFPSEKIAVITAERFEALGTDANRTLDVVNSAQEAGLKVNGAQLLDENTLESLSEDFLEELADLNENGVFFTLTFSVEPTIVEPEEVEPLDEDEEALAARLTGAPKLTVVPDTKTSKAKTTTKTDGDDDESDPLKSA